MSDKVMITLDREEAIEFIGGGREAPVHRAIAAALDQPSENPIRLGDEERERLRDCAAALESLRGPGDEDAEFLRRLAEHTGSSPGKETK